MRITSNPMTPSGSTIYSPIDFRTYTDPIGVEYKSKDFNNKKPLLNLYPMSNRLNTVFRFNLTFQFPLDRAKKYRRKLNQFPAIY